MMLATLLERVSLASTRPKPACMKMTSTAANRIQTLSRAAWTSLADWADAGPAMATVAPATTTPATRALGPRRRASWRPRQRDRVDGAASARGWWWTWDAFPWTGSRVRARAADRGRTGARSVVAAGTTATGAAAEVLPASAAAPGEERTRTPAGADGEGTAPPASIAPPFAVASPSPEASGRHRDEQGRDRRPQGQRPVGHGAPVAGSGQRGGPAAWVMRDARRDVAAAGVERPGGRRFDRRPEQDHERQHHGSE